MNAQSKNQAHARRKRRVRKNMHGTAERPRMTVFKSNKHMYVQVIDDRSGRTLASASTLCEELRGTAGDQKKIEAAKAVGKLAAERCAAAKIDAVIFDRNGYQYTGRVAALADGARENGLTF